MSNRKGLAKFTISKELFAEMLALPKGTTVEMVDTVDHNLINVCVASPDLPVTYYEVPKIEPIILMDVKARPIDWITFDFNYPPELEALPIAELPEAEQALFRAWMRGQTITLMPGALLPDTDTYTVNEYERWQRERLSPFIED